MWNGSISLEEWRRKSAQFRENDSVGFEEWRRNVKTIQLALTNSDEMWKSAEFRENDSVGLEFPGKLRENDKRLLQIWGEWNLEKRFVKITDFSGLKLREKKLWN